MITREYFESGNIFEYDFDLYRVWDDKTIDKMTDGEWGFYCYIEEIRDKEAVVKSDLFGKETTTIIEFKKLEESE